MEEDMQLFSVSIGDIEDDLADFFTTHYGVDPKALTPAADLKKLCGFSGSAWEDLGDTLSDLPWMTHLNVRLGPNDMMVVSTLGQLANRILSKMQQVVAAPTSEAKVMPVKSLMAKPAPRKMPPTKRASARKRRV